MIPFSGTGVLIPFWLGLSWFLASLFYDEDLTENPSYVAWTLTIAAIITALHGLKIIISTRGSGYDAQPRSPWHDAFALIPVLIWPFIFVGGSVYFFLQ
jgi:hypothetical protein